MDIGTNTPGKRGPRGASGVVRHRGQRETCGLTRWQERRVAARNRVICLESCLACDRYLRAKGINVEPSEWAFR